LARYRVQCLRGKKVLEERVVDGLDKARAWGRERFPKPCNHIRIEEVR